MVRRAKKFNPEFGEHTGKSKVEWNSKNPRKITKK